MLPNFFCLGAQKSGTTTIWHILNAHPDICMAHPRETRFFYDDFMFRGGTLKYETQFFSHYNNEKMAGEKCPEYLYDPKIARRIYNTLGKNVNFIVTLRHPVHRAFSHYRHNLAMFREQRTFEEALEEEAHCIRRGKRNKPPYGYIERGYYKQQIERYFEWFSPHQFLFINFEKEILNNQKLLAFRIFNFLGVKPLIPHGLPFQSGHPKLELLDIQYEELQHVIKINRNVAMNNKKGWLRVFNKNVENELTVIHEPSSSSVEYAKNFRRNKAYKLENISFLYQKYFVNHNKELSELIKTDVSNWVDS